MKTEEITLEKTKEMFMAELKDFISQYDFLGEITLTEQMDIDTMDYLYSIENLNGTSVEELYPIIGEISRHMKQFSKKNNIYDYYINACFLL